MRILGAAELRDSLPPAAAVEAMEAAFGDDRETPLRVRLGNSLFMPGRVGATTGMKVVSVVPGNPVGTVVVFDTDGAPLGLVDGATLTAIRTGAASGLATRLLARPDARTLAQLGAGAMAFDQIESVRAVRPIERVLVWSRNSERAARLAAQAGAEVATDASEAVAVADVVCTATPATTPLFDPSAVREGTHFNAVGAFTPEMVELPPELVRRAFVVVDDLEAARQEAGDLLQAGVDPQVTIADLLAGRTQPPAGATTLFKSVGIASQDVAAAAAALLRAEGLGLGTVV